MSPLLRLHITGVGDAFTESYHNASFCIEEPQSGLRLQIDCPPAFPRVLADYRRSRAGKGAGSELGIDSIDHLLLTHLHGDHCGGTEAYLYMRRFLLGRKPRLLGAPQVLDALWPTRLAGGMQRLLLSVPGWDAAALSARAQRRAMPISSDLPQAGDDGALTTDEEQALLADPGGPRVDLGLLDYCDRTDLLCGVTRLGPLRIERRFTRHHIPTTAVRVSIDGRRRPLLGYSADTAFDPDLIDWLAEADCVIHETNYGTHTPLASLLLLPEALRARMRLIHYPDTLDPASCPITCLREGEVLELF
jgi:ribonuclease BN (tRNA processing enzyme)